MLAGGDVKPVAMTIIDNAFVTSSGVAKLTDAEELEPSVLLKNLTDMLWRRAKEAGVKKLWSDTVTLQEWRVAACPTHNDEARVGLAREDSTWQEKNSRRSDQEPGAGIHRHCPVTLAEPNTLCHQAWY